MELNSILAVIALVLALAAVVVVAVLAAQQRALRRSIGRIERGLEVIGSNVSTLSEETEIVDGPSTPTQVAVVLNPSKYEDADAFRRRVEQVIDAYDGAAVSFYETSVEDPGRGPAKQALADGADLVIAAGGDGTVRDVATALAHSEAHMAVIPAGTGNLLARNLGVPLDDVEGALIAALDGRSVKADVGWLRWGMSTEELSADEPEIFLVMAGFGADAEIMGSTDSTLKARIGWLAYIVAGAKKLVGRSHRVIASFPDGRRLAMKARTVILGNVGELPGGIVLMPDADMSNGKLEVLIADWRGAAGFTQVVTGVLNQTKASKSFLSALQRHLTTELTVSTSEPWPVQLDGDTEGEATHLSGRVDRGALRMRVPRES